MNFSNIVSNSQTQRINARTIFYYKFINLFDLYQFLSVHWLFCKILVKLQGFWWIRKFSTDFNFIIMICILFYQELYVILVHIIIEISEIYIQSGPYFDELVLRKVYTLYLKRILFLMAVFFFQQLLETHDFFLITLLCYVNETNYWRFLRMSISAIG